jgi:defect-in-organelle-trafficking protein DotC
MNAGHMKKSVVLMIGVFLLISASAKADTVPPPSYVGAGAGNNNNYMQQGAAAGQGAFDKEAFMQGMQAALNAQNAKGLIPGASPAANQPPKQQNLGDADDPNSEQYKVNQLAKKVAQQRADEATGKKSDAPEEQTPPEIEALQHVNESLAGTKNLISDDPLSKDISADMRKEAQKEAALSYGARGGLARRNYEIMESIQGFDPALDRVFDFRALLIRAPSGMLIEPPIVKESTDALVITEGGNEAAVANAVFEINKRAKIVSAPRDWRQYIIQTWSDVPPPPRILWPKNAQEQTSWNGWVAEGWKAGVDQAEQIFEANVNRVAADYDGMVRYRMLLAQGMISEPYAMQEDRGVTGDNNQMRVGDSALRITGPSKFLTKAALWKPADR